MVPSQNGGPIEGTCSDLLNLQSLEPQEFVKFPQESYDQLNFDPSAHCSETQTLLVWAYSKGLLLDLFGAC